MSSSIREFIEFDLNTLGFFEMIAHIFDSQMVESPKPSPNALRLPLEWLQKNYSINASQCVYVGDSLDDMACSRDQINFFAVLSSSASHQDFILNGLPENKIVDNLGDLYAIVIDSTF